MNTKTQTMMWISDTPGGNYVKKGVKALRGLQPGTYTDIYFHHDDWCRIYNGKRCNCNPDVRLESIDHVPG